MRAAITTCCCFLALFFSLSADPFEMPWGTDCELVGFDPEAAPCCEEKRRGNFLAEILIAFHQDIISPADGPRSHFRPSSSQYALESIRTYGLFEGFLMGCDRLMRENDELWVYRIGYLPDGSPIKLDPVR